jgi:hypothetical protein
MQDACSTVAVYPGRLENITTVIWTITMFRMKLCKPVDRLANTRIVCTFDATRVLQSTLPRPSKMSN